MMPLLLPLLLACGGPLHDGAWKGRHLLEMSGPIFQVGPLPEEDGNPQLTILWARIDTDTTVKTDVLDLLVTFPTEYQLRIYSPPPDDADWHLLAGGFEGPVGTPLLYLDQDDSGTWDQEAREPSIGFADQTIIFWDEEAYEYALVRVDPTCGEGFLSDASDESIPLIIDEGCSHLPDFDCNGDKGEWGVICAPPL